jgi:hypothetical protein
LFDRPKPTAGCSANGRRRRIRQHLQTQNKFNITEINSTSTDVFNPEVTFSMKVGAECVSDIQHFYRSTGREVNDPTVLSTFKIIKVRSDLELSPDKYFMVNEGYQLFDRDVDDDALATQ